MTGAEAVSERKQTVTWILVGFGSAFVLVMAFSIGRESLRETAAARARTVDMESRSFCGGLGFKSQSELFARCMNGLTDIRRQAREQLEQETASLF